MAAPESKSIKDLTGTWVLNKDLSDDIRETLQLQGISMLVRNAIHNFKITLHIKQGVNGEGVTTIDIKQVADGNIPFVSSTTIEKRVLDNLWREHEDHIFKKVKGRSHFITLGSYQDASGTGHLSKGFLAESEQPDGAFESYVESIDNGWTATQIWGFEEVSGARRYVRRILVQKGEQKKTIKLVYDFVSAEPGW